MKEASNDIKGLSVKKLKKTVLEMWDVCYGQSPCYGVRDMIRLYACMNELEKRGYVIASNLKIFRER